MKKFITIAIMLIIVIPIIGHAQTFDHNLFEQGALDTLAADSTSVVSDTIYFSGGQKGGMTIRGHLKKLSGDDKTLTIKALLFFDKNDPTDISDEKTLGTQAVTTTQINYSYSLPNYNFWGVARGAAIIYEIPSGGTMPAIEIKGKALTR